MTTLHTLPPLLHATVLHRPSKQIKSPYVADIRLDDGTEALCHSPGLGCSGLVASGTSIYVSKATGSKAKTAYTTQIAECTDSEGTYYVGIHPMVSQLVASKLLSHIATDVSWKSEVKINDHTRLDYVGTAQNGKKIYVEVKNAMISCSNIERPKRKAIFPEGYRKSKTETASPRAVKHAETLGSLMKDPTTEAAYLVFIVPRNDCKAGLELNKQDPIYCKAVSSAVAAGVKVRAFSLEFTKDGSIKFDVEAIFHYPKVA